MADDKAQAAGMRIGAFFPTGTIVPDFPKLPRQVIERFPELKGYEVSVKKWVDELTTALRNTR